MDLKEYFSNKGEYIFEGGNMFPNAGAIHKSEVPATIKDLESKLGINLSGQELGSVGKKDYSGDLDFVITLTMPKDEFKALLVKTYGATNVRPLNDGFTLLAPIIGFNKAHNQRQPRTGFVQTDFVISDDHNYSRFYFHSPGEESVYKGAHRTAALAALVRLVDPRIIDGRLDDYDRPLREVRWKISPNGLIRVNRQSIKNPVTNTWQRKREDTVLRVVKDPQEIAKILFGDTGTSKDVESLESIIAAVKRVYPAKKEDIFFDIVESLKRSDLTDDVRLPPELEKYV